MAKPISYKKKFLKYPDGGLIPDLNFLNKDFKKWNNEEKKLYQYLKYNHIIEPNKQIEDYITENRKQYRDIQDKLSKERESFYKTNPNATPNDFEKYAEPKGLFSDYDAFIPNLYLDNDAYDKYYGEGYKGVFYDLNQQYNPQKYLGLKSKDEYKEYLQSDKYKDIAKKFWGDDSDKFVQKQLTDIDNAQYKSFKESDIHDQLQLAPGRLAAYNPIYNTINMYQGNMRKVIPHEISHLTNRNENPLSEDEAYEFKQLRPNGLIQRIPKQITDEQKKRLEMSSQFSKWKDLSNEFKTQFDKNASPEYKQYPDAIDYLTDPNEVRARVNAIRSELNRKNIKWNNTSDIENYINTLPDTDEIKGQYRDLNYIDKDLKNKLFNEYAYQKANSNKSLFTAKHGGYIHNNMAGKLNKRKGLPTRFPMYYTGGTPEMYMGTSDYFDKQNQIAGQNAAITNLAAQGLSFVPGWGQAASVALKAGQAASNLVGQKDMYGVAPTGFQQAAAATLDPLGSINSLIQGQNPYAYKKMLGEEGKLATSYSRGKTSEQQDAYTQQMKAAEGQYMAMGGYMPMYAPGGIMNPTNPIREPSAWIGKDYYKTAKGNYRDYGFIKAPQSGYYTRDNEYFTLEPANTLGDYGMFAAVDPTKPTPTINPNIIPNTTTATTTVKKPQFSWKQVDPWDLEKRYNEMAKKGMIEIKEDKGKTYIKRLYAMGGRMTNPYSGEPNAEIEGEVVSHSNGGIQDFSHLPNHEQATSANEVNLAEGSKILSKRITDPLTGKKFATVGKKYSTSREENVLNNNRLPELSNRSAKLSLIAKKKAFDDVFERHEATKVFNDAQKAENEATEDFIGMLGGMYGKGGLIKRKDGSYSPRGLWDNIRANRGSGKKPTKAMLEQERKIKAQEKAMGGYMYAEGGNFNNPGFKALPKYVQAKIKGNYADGGTYVTAGDEYHRIYKNAEGDIMVNHPKEDKGKWDTINLTDKAGAKTIKQGVAATKKWHRENPYAYGGYMNMYEAGGYVLGESYDMSEEELQELKNQGYTFDIE